MSALPGASLSAAERPTVQALSTKLVFVGTGVSTAIPVMGHFGQCACRDAIANPSGPNRRNNVSILIELEMDTPQQEQQGQEKTENKFDAGAPVGSANRRNILVDVGKTFRTAYFDCLVKRGLQRLDTLLLTHDHADAIQGLDDVRDLQKFTDSSKEGHRCLHYVQTLCSPTTWKTLNQQVAYITRNSRLLGSADSPQWQTPFPNGGVIERRSTALDVMLVDEVAPMSLSHLPCLHGLPMVSVPLIHGPKYISMGYVFGYGLPPFTATTASVSAERAMPQGPTRSAGGGIVAYLSDISEMPEATMAYLQNIEGGIDILVVDMLLGPKKDHFSHFCFDQAVALTEALSPKRMLAVGMFCELEHHATNKLLSDLLAERHREGRMQSVVSMELAFDGMELDISADAFKSHL